MAQNPLLISLFLLCPLLTLSLQPTYPPPPPLSPFRLIQKTCSLTSYHRLCMSTLRSDPRSVQASDVKALSAIVIGTAISHAANTSLYISSLAKNTTTLAGSVLSTCAGRYASAVEALHRAVDAMAEESYDYAYVHVSAVAEYPNICSRLFHRYPGMTYPVEMARRAEGLERLCAIALDMISLLG